LETGGGAQPANQPEINRHQSAQAARNRSRLCADCASFCAQGGRASRNSGRTAREKALPKVARALRNPSGMNTTILATETPAQNITQLYMRYREFVSRVCNRYVQNPDDAEDLVQEVFLKAEKALADFAGQSQPSTWLYRIAVNHCLDNLRQRKRQRDLAAAYALDLERDAEEEEAETPSGMRHILDRLREETDNVDGQILYLRFNLGLTHEAIARIRGVSRVAITKRLSKIQSRALELHAEFEQQTVREAA
jgi:RNA polymerase sigma-70 factor, ECF subfamily